MALSGGGFRATLAALGALRYLADVGLLCNVRLVSSVSGGSIANGMLATQWAILAIMPSPPRASITMSLIRSYVLSADHR